MRLGERLKAMAWLAAEQRARTTDRADVVDALTTLKVMVQVYWGAVVEREDKTDWGTR